jgi:hypothetical protein
VNGTGTTLPAGGPNNVATIPARAYPAGGAIKFDSPARSVQYVLLESGSNEFIKVTDIDITGAGGASTITTPGGTLQLSADVMPANAGEQDVIWSIVSGSDKATINSSGLVTATGNGTVVVRATANDESTLFDEFTITISGQLVTAIEAEVLAEVRVFPNPASDRIQIRSAQSVATLELRSTVGTLLLAEDNREQLESVEMALDSVPAGLHLLVLRDREGRTAVRKLVVRSN